MSNLAFTRATKKQAKLRLAIIGPEGSGKTWTALAVGTKLGSRVAVIDTENGSASKYAGDFEFDTVTLDSFSPLTYVEAIQAAAAAGYDVLVIDSLSHAWSGKDGALEQVDRRAGANKFAAWREVTPMHQQLVDSIIRAPMHVIASMRSKTEYAVEQDGGRTKVVKLGLAPVQRDGISYEFDVIGDIDQNHNLRITKTRCRALDNQVIPRPGAELAATLRAWLSEGAEATPAAPPRAEEEMAAAVKSTTADSGEPPAATSSFVPPKASKQQRDTIASLVAQLVKADPTVTKHAIAASVQREHLVTGEPGSPDEHAVDAWADLSAVEASGLLDKLSRRLENAKQGTA